MMKEELTLPVKIFRPVPLCASPGPADADTVASRDGGKTEGESLWPFLPTIPWFGRVSGGN